MHKEIAIQETNSSAETSVSKDYKQTKLGWIPKDWEIKLLGDLSIIKGDYGINAAAVPLNPNLPIYLRITDITENGSLDEANQKSVNNVKSNDFYLDVGDIVFARTGATVGKTYLHNKANLKLVFAGFLIRFRLNENYLLPKYLKLFTETHYYDKWVKVFSVRSGQPGINSKEYCRLPIPVPPLPEQRKIAQTLSSWDKAIALQEQLIVEKQALKKGLMQELLTGKKRFPGFQEDWEEVKINDIVQKKSSNLTASSISELDGVYKVYGATGFLQKINFYNEEEEYISIVKDGAGVGRVLLCESKSSVLGTLDILKAKNNTNLYFLYLILSNINFKKYIIGSTIPHIYFKDYKLEKVLIPSSKEQQKIAKILSNFDNEIENLIKYKDYLIQQKQGLMQQLLTGEKRVKI